MKLQIFTSLFAIILLTGCISNTDKFRNDIRAKYKNYPYELSSMDSIIVKKDYNGDFKAYLNFMTGNMHKTIKSYPWSRAAKHLLMSEKDTQKAANEMGFENPFYFMEYLRCDTITSPEKIKIIDNLKKKLLTITKDSAMINFETTKNIMRMSLHYNMQKTKSCENKCKCKN